MQENERLRMALFDAQAALEALPPSESAGAEEKKSAVADEGELQWRELCTSIARGADEEKAMLLEELNNVRSEMEPYPYPYPNPNPSPNPNPKPSPNTNPNPNPSPNRNPHPTPNPHPSHNPHPHPHPHQARSPPSRTRGARACPF